MSPVDLTKEEKRIKTSPSVTKIGRGIHLSLIFICILQNKYTDSKFFFFSFRNNVIMIISSVLYTLLVF